MRALHACECPVCAEGSDPQVLRWHRQMNTLLSRLDEQQRRWYAAVEAEHVGRGGTRLVAQITGLDVQTIRRGRREVARELVDRPVDGVRLPGAGRPPLEKKRPRVGTHPGGPSGG